MASPARAYRKKLSGHTTDVTIPEPLQENKKWVTR